MHNRPPDKILSLELCRFIAAFCVMVDHQVSFIGAQNIAGPGPLLGGFDLPPIMPVLFFFVLSGFVMMTAHHQDFGRLERIPRYAWRRFCRIFPMYWLSLPIWLYFLWPTFTSHYLFKILTLDPFIGQFVELNSPAWTLRFELAFYLMFGISLLPYIGRLWLAAWIFLVFWFWFPNFMPFQHFAFTRHWHPVAPAATQWHFFDLHEIYFFAGLAAGFILLRCRLPSLLNWALLAAGAAGVLAFTRLSAWGFGYPSIDQAPGAALAIGAFIYALSALEQAGALPVRAAFARLGAMSYPLYIFHPALIYAMLLAFYYHPAWRHAFTPLSLLAAFLIVTLALTAAITFLIDRPLQRALRRIG